ncbi:MAG: bifunctional transcriptional activator/DNA repair enzyme AdaA, partial [Planctomycetota bacterium]
MSIAAPTAASPSTDEMYDALVRRDAAYEGVFVAGIRTTGICCRPTCPARKPRRENVEFFPSVREALLAGYRACKRCHPLEPVGTVPAWLREIVDAIDQDPARRWRDQDLRDRGLDPARVRRWFQRHHDMTFHAYQRSRRLGAAIGRLHQGDDILKAGLDAGFESASGFRDAFAKLFGHPPGTRTNGPMLTVTRLTSPLGPFLAAATDEALYMLEFVDRRMLPTQIERLCRR